MRSESFETAGDTAVTLHVPAGEIVVQSGAAGRTVVELEPLRDDQVTREAIEHARVGVRRRGDGADEVYVEVQKRSGWLGRGPQLEVRVSCPDGAHLDVTTASADVLGRGVFGDVSVKGASGDVLVDEVGGALRVNTASGDVRVRSVGGEAVVNAVSGDVHLERVAGALAGRTVSGDLRVGGVGGDADVNSVSGDVHLTDVATDTRVHSVSGDVRAAIRRGARVHVDASSVSGSMSSELDLGDAPPEGDGPVVELRAKTVSGDVLIARSTAGAAV